MVVSWLADGSIDSIHWALERLLPESVPVHVIGDALAPRRMTHAALEGARIGLAV